MIEKTFSNILAEKDPLAAAMEIIKKQYAEIQSFKEQIQTLKDEIAALKKSSKRPKIRANKRTRSEISPVQVRDVESKRPGSEKKCKDLEIHETKVIRPKNIPEGSKLKRTRSFDVQDLHLKVHNIRYFLEEWETPSGEILSAQMPEGETQGHFGNELCAFILDQHHQCQVTQPLLHEQLQEFGIDISVGQLNHILTEDNQLFHQEKEEILQAGLKVSDYIQTDDTGARHDGKNGYCTQIGNEFFAWFKSTESKSRINFLQILSSSYSNSGYFLDENAFEYMTVEGLPKVPLLELKKSIGSHFLNKNDWEKFLLELQIKSKNHIKIATEGALLSGCLKEGLNKDLVILSDDAGQFNIPLLTHALCWVHEGRHIKNLLPSTDIDRKKQQDILDDFWNLYRKFKDHKSNPNEELKKQIQTSFDGLFQRKTGYANLDLVLKRAFAKKQELLVALERTDVPLHNNSSETDIREYVKRRKVSGGTRSVSGQQSRDTFASLKKTCRKLGVSFYSYLKDRLSGVCKIAKLSSLVEEAAKKKTMNTPLSQGVAA